MMRECRDDHSILDISIRWLPSIDWCYCSLLQLLGSVVMVRTKASTNVTWTVRWYCCSIESHHHRCASLDRCRHFQLCLVICSCCITCLLQSLLYEGGRRITRDLIRFHDRHQYRMMSLPNDDRLTSTTKRSNTLIYTKILLIGFNLTRSLMFLGHMVSRNQKS